MNRRSLVSVGALVLGVAILLTATVAAQVPAPLANKPAPAPKQQPVNEIPGFKVLDASTGSQAGASDEPLGFGEILVPDFTGQSKRQAVMEVGKLGLEPLNWQGSGNVTAQYPPPGSRVLSGTRIQLKFSQRK